jgi:hypothetical protein
MYENNRKEIQNIMLFLRRLAQEFIKLREENRLLTTNQEVIDNEKNTNYFSI